MQQFFWGTEDLILVQLRELFKKLRREKLRPKNTTGGGGGGQRCQKDTTVPTKSDFISNYIGPF